MLDSAKTKQDQAMQSLEKNRKKEKTVDWQTAQTIRKGHVLNSKCCQKRAKLRLSNLLKRKYSVVLDFFVVDVQKSWLAFVLRKTYIWWQWTLILFWFVKKNIVAYHSHSFKGLLT